ncbi:MAG TPA: hypothetical protein VNM16_05895 [Bacillota bacterium]|nr:hypothetical protein [Bacillota bacterium]
MADVADNRSQCADSAVALGHLGILAETLSGAVGDWQIRLVDGDAPEEAQQAAHIRGLLARAAEELDELAAAMAEQAEGAPPVAGETGAAEGAVNAPHLEMGRRVHAHGATRAARGYSWSDPEDVDVVDDESEEIEGKVRR